MSPLHLDPRTKGLRSSLPLLPRRQATLKPEQLIFQPQRQSLALMLFMFGVGAVFLFINFLALRQAVTPAPLLGRMMVLSVRLMRELGVTNGFRHVINTGRDGHQ